MGYMLETRGLTKRFGRGDQAQDAVADVSLHIREGEVYGLLGPNGAGKSTTLKMICGMLRPTAGEILFAGHACSCSTSPRRISISATRSTCCEYFATLRNRGMWLSSCPSTNSSSRRKAPTR